MHFRGAFQASSWRVRSATLRIPPCRAWSSLLEEGRSSCGPESALSQIGVKGVFAEKGAHFHGKRGLGTPPPQNSPYTPLPLPPLLEDPPPLGFSRFPGEKRHININFLLWLTSRWPWDKRVVVPGLTGPKSLCVRLETQEIQTFPSG